MWKYDALRRYAAETMKEINRIHHSFGKKTRITFLLFLRYRSKGHRYELCQQLIKCPVYKWWTLSSLYFPKKPTDGFLIDEKTKNEANPYFSKKERFVGFETKTQRKFKICENCWIGSNLWISKLLTFCFKLWQ